MMLKVIGTPQAATTAASNHILVAYSPRTETTVVNCDVDIVTLGIAVNVLTKQYSDYLGSIEPHLAKKIHDTTAKAVTDFGQD